MYQTGVQTAAADLATQPIDGLRHPDTSLPPLAPEKQLIRLAKGLADPYIVKFEGRIFLTGTEKGYERICLRSCGEISSIPSASVVTVYEGGPELWAPELHFLEAEKKQSKIPVIIFTEGLGENHRLRVLACKNGAALTDWEDKGIIRIPGADNWAIDGTYFNWKDQLYLVWSGWQGSKDREKQNLYIIPMLNPWTADPGSERVCISQPQYKWESWINEGPQVYTHPKGATCIYSAHESFGDHYAQGMLLFNGSDPMNPKAWKKRSKPIFQSCDIGSDRVIAPGHGSMLIDSPSLASYIFHMATGPGRGWDRETVMLQVLLRKNLVPDFQL